MYGVRYLHGITEALDAAAQLLPDGPARRALRYVAAELEDGPAAEARYAEVHRRRLTAAWRSVVAETAADHRAHYWSTARFEREWRKHLDPRTGYPHELPYLWRHRLEALQDTGIPWSVVKAQIVFVLEQGRNPSFATVLRRCRTTLRGMRAQADSDG